MNAFSRFASWMADLLGRPSAFVIALVATVGWFVSGPLFTWSDTWQLVINTFTTVVTFLMLFVLQHSQNRDTKALHAKLDELVRSHDQADDAVVGIERD